MNSWRSRMLVIAPAVVLLLIGVSSVAFAWGASSRNVVPAMSPRPSAAMGGGQNPQAPNARGGSAVLVVGTVTGKTSSTIDVTTTAGKSVTVNVASSTQYSVRGIANATMADIAVGSAVSVQGAYQSDGTFNATLVQLGRVRGDRGFGGNGGGVRPLPSPAASGASL